MTNDTASTAAAADALDRIRETITELLGRADALEADVLRAAGLTGDAFADAHRAVADFLGQRVRPWQAAAEQSLYRAGLGIDRTRLLVEGLVGEGQMIEQAQARLTRTGTDRARIAADVSALRVLLAAQLGKISDLLLPALAAEPGVRLDRIAATLLAPPDAVPAPAGGCHGGPCVCGDSN